MGLIPFDASIKLIKGILKHITNIKFPMKILYMKLYGLINIFYVFKNKIIQNNNINCVK
jgi:hypothetical protein